METANKRNEWIFGKIRNPLEDKDFMIKHSVIQMLNKSTRIFKYKGLPDTILQKDLETILQVGGYAIWKEVGGKLYVFSGGLGGEPNPYYLPTIAIIANPALRYNASLKIDEECVVMLNDHYYQGLMPLFSKYANLLAEAELSLKQAIINARIPAFIQADNDATYQSAVEVINKIVKGEDYGIVLSREFFEGLKSFEFCKEPLIKDIIESIQYIKGSWYNEIGLNATFNMKREAINEAEATINEDILYPTIDTMLECRKYYLEKVNSMFGTNITVELDSVWQRNKRREELSIEMEEKEVDIEEKSLKGGEENEDTGNTDTSPKDSTT